MSSWSKLADSLSWAQGHQGKGYLLHDGTIKTWNVDTFNPIDHFTVHQQNGETSPSALNFEIDPDGGVVTKEPTTKVDAILNADSRLYDAGQRPVFEDDFDLQSFEPSPKEKHSPDYNFIMSREHSSGIYHYHPWTGLPCVCQWGESKHRGKTSSSQYIRQIKNQKQKAFRTPEGERFLEALDNLIERFPDAEAMAPWMASRYKKGDMALSPGGEIYHHIGFNGNELPEHLEQLKRGHWDQASTSWEPGSGYGVEDLAKKLAYDKWNQLPWGKRYDPLGRARMDRSGELRISPKQLSELVMEGYHPILAQLKRYFEPTDGSLTDWSHWFNARQHPTRRGIDIMQHSPGSVRNMAREHALAMEEARKKERWFREYTDPELGEWEKPQVKHVFGPEAGPYENWNVVQLNGHQAEGDSQALGHCIGSDDQPYRHNIDSGNIEAYSLRDAEGYPHVSWHINPSGQGIGHMQGQGDVPEKYRDLISMFNEAYDLPDEEVGEEELEPQYDAEVDLPAAESIDDWLYQLENAGEEAESLGNIGPETQVNIPYPNWTSLAYDYLHGYGDRDAFHRALQYEGDPSSFAYALGAEMDPTDIDHRQAVDWWNSEGARHSQDWVDYPRPETNEVDRYNEAIDEEEPNVTDWDHMANDYLNHPDFYGGDQSYDRFHRNLIDFAHQDEMRDALAQNVAWGDRSHQQAIEAWNTHWRQQDPDYVIPQPANPPYEEDPNMPVDQYGYGQTVDEPGFGPVQSKWEWQRVSDYQGWTNWETWNTALMMDNEYETYTKARELVQQGATPQQLEQWVLQAVVGPHNQAMIKDAQEWNAIDPDERRRMTDERDREQYGDEAVDLTHRLMEPFGGFSDPGEDDSAEIIDPNEVNWYEIYTHIYQELQGNREWATEKGEEFPELPEQHPNPMDQPGDLTLPEGWTSRLKTSDGYMMDPIAVPGKEEMSPPRNEQEAVFQAIGEAAQNGDYERARWLYQFLPEDMNPVNQEPMQSGHEILSPAVELQEWLGDLGGEEPEAPSIHHDSPEDTIVAPQTSTSEALPYFPPGNIPKEYKQGGMTRNQYLRRMAELEQEMGPDRSRLHHEFDNGWSVTAPKSQRDVKRIGTLMGHCWQGGYTGTGEPYVLRDPDGIPRVAWNVTSPHMAGAGHTPSDLPPGTQVFAGGAHAPAGHANAAPKPEQWEMIREWAAAQNPPTLMWHFTGQRDGGYGGHELGEPGPNPYWDPAANQFKQSAEFLDTSDDYNEYYDITDHPDLWCSKCGKSGMQYYKPKRPGTGAVWYCPHCEHSYHTADIPKTDDPEIDRLVYKGMQDQWRPQHEVTRDLNQADELADLLGIEEERPVPPGLPPNARPIPPEHQNMDLQCADCGNRRLREEGYAQDPATGNIYCLTCAEARMHLGSAKTADSPITQADATNDPLGKSPAMIPQRDGDPDYLEVAPCPNCQQLHRPDEPCPTNSVTQFRQQERAWYNRDNNAQHGPGPGPNGLEDHARISGSWEW